MKDGFLIGPVIHRYKLPRIPDKLLPQVRRVEHFDFRAPALDLHFELGVDQHFHLQAQAAVGFFGEAFGVVPERFPGVAGDTGLEAEFDRACLAAALVT